MYVFMYGYYLWTRCTMTHTRWRCMRGCAVICATDMDALFWWLLSGESEALCNIRINCVCMYTVCMYTCTLHVCMYTAWMYVYTLHACMYVCMYVHCMYVRTLHVCMHTCILKVDGSLSIDDFFLTWIHLCMCVCMYVCMYQCGYHS